MGFLTAKTLRRLSHHHHTSHGSHSVGRAVQKTYRRHHGTSNILARHRSKPRNVIRSGISGASPFAGAQRQASRRTRAAANRLPQQVRVPAVPLLSRYSKSQQRTVDALFRRAARGSGKTYDAFKRDADKQTRLRIKAAERSGRQEQQRYAAQSYRRRVAAQAAGATEGQILAGAHALTPAQRRRLKKAAPVLAELRRGHTTPIAWQARRERAYERTLPQSRQTIKPISRKHPPKEGGGTDILGLAIPPSLVRFATQRTLLGPLGHGIGKFPGFKDAVNLPANLVTGSYYGGAAAIEALQGRPQRARALVHSFTHHDPIALAVQGKWGQAVKAAAAHPLYTGLEVSGAGSALGKGAGLGDEAAAFARGVARGSTDASRLRAGLIAKAAVRHRAPQTLEGTNVLLPRRHSKNLATRSAVKAADRRRAAFVEKHLKQADLRQAQGRVGAARELRMKAAKRSGLQVSERGQRRALDEHVAMNEAIRRLNRAQVIHAVGKVLPRHGRRAMSTVVQGITRPSPASIQRYILDLEHQATHGDLGPAQKLANESLRHELGKALQGRAGRKADWTKVEQAATEFSRVTRPLEQHLIDRGVFDAHQVAKARAIPYAVQHMGATHDATGEARALARGQDIEHQLGVLEADRQQLVKRLAAHDSAGAQARARTQILPDGAAAGHPHAGNRLAEHYQQLHQVRQAIADAGPGHPRLEELRRERNRIQNRIRRTRRRLAATSPEARVQLERAQTLRTAAQRAAGRGDHRGAAQALADAQTAERLAQRAGGAAAPTRTLRATQERRALHAEIGRREAAQRALQAERSKTVPGLVDSNGRPLTLDQIHEHMRANGVDPEKISFLTQAPNRRGARNFYKSFYPRQAERHMTRTGEATRKGTFDSHVATLTEQGGRLQGLVDADVGFQRFIRDFGLHDQHGTLVHGDRRAMEKLAADHAAHSGRQLRVVRLNPFLAKQQMLEHLLEEDHATAARIGAPNGAVTKALQDAIGHSSAGAEAPATGDFGLVDHAVADQLHTHLESIGGRATPRLLRAVNQQFRRTVLATRVTWLTGNVVEAALRNVIAGAGPGSYYVGRQLFGQPGSRIGGGGIDRAFGRAGIKPEDVPALAAEARVQTVGGGHFAMAEKQHVHTGAEQFRSAGPILRRAAHGLGAFWRAPGPKHVARAWDLWTKLVFHDINGRLESNLQMGLAGKYARNFLMDGHAIKVSRKAIQQAADGLTNTPEQAAMGRFIDRAYGQYDKFSPQQRHVIAVYTPFLAWSLNAARFVFKVLPKDHPVKTALLASLVVHSEQWRKAHGLDIFSAGAAPGFLQGSIPMSDGSKLRISRYTPFGFFSDPTDSIATLVMPQYSGALLALRGLDWKGNPLKVGKNRAPNTAEKFAIALDQFFGGTIPLFAQGAQAAGLEGTSDRSTSDRISGVLNPFNPVAPKQSATGGTGKWDFGSGSGSSGGTGKWEFGGP